MKRILLAATLVAMSTNVRAQQSMPGMDMGEHQPSPQQSPTATRPTATLQEQEDPTLHTGSDLPAPELLSGVSDRPSMTVEEFLTLAETHNPTLAQARTLITRSQQQARQAALPPNPTLGYSGDHIRGGEYGGGEQGAYLQQELVLGGKLGLRRDIYQQQARSEEAGVDEQRYRVRNDVQQAFYSALMDQALVATRQSMLQQALDASDAAHQLANLGQADAPDVLQAEVEAEQAKIDFVRAQREYLQAFQVLAAVAGNQHMLASPLKGNLEAPPQLDPAQQIVAILADSPALHRAQQEVAVAEARLKAAKRESVPNLTLRAGEYYSGETIDSSHKPAGPETFADASIDLPLWNRNQGTIEAAKADVEHARLQVTSTQLELKRQAEPLAQRYLAARFEAERYKTQILPRAQRAYDLYLMKYQQMSAAYPQVLHAQHTLLQLHINYLQSLSEEWSNALALQNNAPLNAPDMGAGAK